MLNVIVVGTNAYSPLALRLMRRWREFYLGITPYQFWYFGDINPADYDAAAEWIKTKHKDWKDGTNSKFAAVAKVHKKLGKAKDQYLFYLDADTSVDRGFSLEKYLGEGLVAAKHWLNKHTPAEKLPFDRWPRSRCYVPLDQRRQVYYMGAFWGGDRASVVEMARECDTRMQADLSEGYDAAVNDESYTNWYFNQAKLAAALDEKQFPFVVSHKGGLGNTRRMDLDVKPYLDQIKALNGHLFDLKHGKVVKDEHESYGPSNLPSEAT